MGALIPPRITALTPSKRSEENTPVPAQATEEPDGMGRREFVPELAPHQYLEATSAAALRAARDAVVPQAATGKREIHVIRSDADRLAAIGNDYVG